jgi:hypothetical protein
MHGKSRHVCRTLGRIPRKVRLSSGKASSRAERAQALTRGRQAVRSSSEQHISGLRSLSAGPAQQTVLRGAYRRRPPPDEKRSSKASSFVSEKARRHPTHYGLLPSGLVATPRDSRCRKGAGQAGSGAAQPLDRTSAGCDGTGRRLGAKVDVSRARRSAECCEGG